MKVVKRTNGIDVILTGDEVAVAIDAYLAAHEVVVRGARTVTVNNQLCEMGSVFVDPAGFVISKGKKFEAIKEPGQNALSDAQIAALKDARDLAMKVIKSAGQHVDLDAARRILEATEGGAG